MNCPGCNGRCELKEDLYFCRKCGAEEKDLTGFGHVWMRAGKVIEAKELVEKSLKQAKKAYPTGEFKE